MVHLIEVGNTFQRAVICALTITSRQNICMHLSNVKAFPFFMRKCLKSHSANEAFLFIQEELEIPQPKTMHCVEKF